MIKRIESTDFAKEERELFVFRVRTATFYLTVPLVLSFYWVDLIFAYQHRWLFLEARLMSIPVSLIAFFLYRVTAVREKFYIVPMQLIFWYLGIYNAFLVYYTGAEHSAYYAGLNLASGGALSFLPLSALHMVLLGLATYGPYIGVVLMKGPSHVDWSIFVPNLAFCGSTMVLGVVTNLFTRTIRFREFSARKELENEIRSKDDVINQKTQEGIYLEKLTNQFSPQIINAVKNGRVAIDGLVRREVTCIFVDVESSTTRSVKLDRDDYTMIMSEFFTLVSEIFVRHDVTVGTYLGDGMLAFTNAPQEDPGHRKKALEACLEVLRSHNSRKKYYLERWRNPFNIRLGVNTGFVYVGFFPSFKRGTYTALGASVNLASRLCAQAPANSILVTKTFVKSLAGEFKDVNVSAVGELSSIKGFEGERYELYSISPMTHEEAKDQESCPLCATVLTVQNEMGDSVLLKCLKCGYTDLADSQSRKAKAA